MQQRSPVEPYLRDYSHTTRRDARAESRAATRLLRVPLGSSTRQCPLLPHRVASSRSSFSFRFGSARFGSSLAASKEQSSGSAAIDASARLRMALAVCAAGGRRGARRTRVADREHSTSKQYAAAVAAVSHAIRCDSIGYDRDAAHSTPRVSARARRMRAVDAPRRASVRRFSCECSQKRQSARTIRRFESRRGVYRTQWNTISRGASPAAQNVSRRKKRVDCRHDESVYSTVVPPEIELISAQIAAVRPACVFECADTKLRSRPLEKRARNRGGAARLGSSRLLDSSRLDSENGPRAAQAQSAAARSRATHISRGLCLRRSADDQTGRADLRAIAARPLRSAVLAPAVVQQQVNVAL